MKLSGGWVVLFGLLAALLGTTLVSDRAARPPDRGEEPTYALQAASLAWDFDLHYSDQDYRRYREQWGVRPGGLDLESGTQAYRRPFLHALVAAPFVRAMPHRGMRVANALLLATAALLTAWTLARICGPNAPFWVAVFVFASAAFSYVFWATADVFLLTATACGFALVYSGQREDPLPSMYGGERSWSWRIFGRWLAVGLLLAIPGAYRSLYLLLLVPAAVALRASVVRRRRSAWAGLVIGAVGLLLGTASVTHFELEPDPSLLFWNAVYFFAGRHVGVLLYFLPLLLILIAARADRGRWALPVAAALTVLGFLVTRPYDFAGFADGPGNRLFLPLYAALWFLPARPVRTGWALALAILAAPLLPLFWTVPGTARLSEAVQGAVERWLPYEASQRELPGEWISEGGIAGIRIKPASRSVWRSERGKDLRIVGAERGELVVASSNPLERLVLDFERSAPGHLEANGADLRPTWLSPDGSISFDVPLGSGRTHPMWWSSEAVHLYSLRIRLPEAPVRPIGFHIREQREQRERRDHRKQR